MPLIAHLTLPDESYFARNIEPAPPPVAAPGPEPEASGTVVEITSTPDDAEIELDDEAKSNLQVSVDAVKELLVACKGIDGSLN